MDHRNSDPNRGRANPGDPNLLNVPGSRLQNTPSRESLRSNASSIRIRRLPSHNLATDPPDNGEVWSAAADAAVANRRRSSSAPQRIDHQAQQGTDLARVPTADAYAPMMPPIQEGFATSAPGGPSGAGDQTRLQAPHGSMPSRPGGMADLHAAGSGPQATFNAGNFARTNRGMRRFRSGTAPSRANPTGSQEYDSDVVGFLDLVDPEVQTLGTLTNVQNSLFVPDLGRLLNRRPTYDLTSRTSTFRAPGAGEAAPRSRRGTTSRPLGSTGETTDTASPEREGEAGLGRTTSISSRMTDSHWAVLPHGTTLEDWTEEDIAELNDHVRHLLHSRREGFKRSMRGFRKYVSKPLGLFVTVYAVLVTLFGAAWVIFLIGWIYVGEEQSYAINVIDNVLVALFALIGDGMAPFRLVDTYHMCLIAHYHHLTWEVREKRHMPKLPDHNDLPGRRRQSLVDVEPGENQDDLEEKQEYTVLSRRQQKRLQYHQSKFSKSHTFYKPHETSTHHAFPLRLLVAVVVLLDCHSLFQVALGTCTWSIDYRDRPQALTATILSCSITCNIVAGILVSIGDKRTRKKDVTDRLFRQDLTREAIEKIQKRHSFHDRRNYDDIDESGDGRKASRDAQRDS